MEASVSGPSNYFSVKSKELTVTVLTWRSPNVICDYVVEATPQGKRKWWDSQAGRPCAADSLSFFAASDTAFLGEDVGSQGREHVRGPCCRLPICPENGDSIENENLLLINVFSFDNNSALQFYDFMISYRISYQ